jgi:hypothetical protein
MTNQFSERIKPEVLAEYMARGKDRQNILGYCEQITSKPGLCLLPSGSSYLYFRIAGKLHKLGVRSLVYYAMHQKSPVFWPCQCKNKACINPYHQNGSGL